MRYSSLAVGRTRYNPTCTGSKSDSPGGMRHRLPSKVHSSSLDDMKLFTTKANTYFERYLAHANAKFRALSWSKGPRLVNRSLIWPNPTFFTKNVTGHRLSFAGSSRIGFVLRHPLHFIVYRSSHLGTTSLSFTTRGGTILSRTHTHLEHARTYARTHGRSVGRGAVRYE